jgi:hypothetical protein
MVISCFPSGSNLLRTVHWCVPLGTLNLLLYCTLSLVSSGVICHLKVISVVCSEVNNQNKYRGHTYLKMNRLILVSL